MLPYERRIVAALLSDDDAGRGAQTTAYVDGALGAMPEVLRFGIRGLSVGLGAWASVRRAVGAERSPADEVAWLDEHPVGLVRQWVRALRSLVLFSEQEALQMAE